MHDTFWLSLQRVLLDELVVEHYGMRGSSYQGRTKMGQNEIREHPAERKKKTLRVEDGASPTTSLRRNT